MPILNRLISLPEDYSFFLFGARGTGKSTLLENTFNMSESIYINLLSPQEEFRFSKNPDELQNVVMGSSDDIKFIIIDEIQKIPKLLDVVHLLIETKKCKKTFILTGSSARQLKSAGVNLLAGRAFTFNLYPFSFIELKEKFILQDALQFGLLPKLYELKTDAYKKKFLQSYALTYLKEEIWLSRLVSNLDNFRRFLEVAAQANGKIVNYTNIARDVGVDDKTVSNYFGLLEDTLLGFFLKSFHNSFRKRLKKAAKFYFFDLGIARTLSSTLSVLPVQGTSYYGELFESFIIIEIFKLVNYFNEEYKLSYLMTQSNQEIDLVVERPHLPTLLIEIKSKDNVVESDLRHLIKLSQEFENCESICLSQDPRKKQIGNVIIYPWREGLVKFFEI